MSRGRFWSKSINQALPGDGSEGDFAFSASFWNGGIPTDGRDAAPEINAMLAEASAAGFRTGRNQRVLFPTGMYTYGTNITIPANVSIWGDGPATIWQQSDGAEVICATGFLHSKIQSLMIRGQAAFGGAVVGRGISMVSSQFMSLEDMQIWYFETGIALSDGTPYSAHHHIGPNLSVNLCRTGILAGPNGNSNHIESVRVFWCFGPANEGVALDVDSASGLVVVNMTSDSADTSLRIRNTGPTGLRFTMVGGFLEPGTNPDTAQVGTPYDIDVPNDNVVEPVVQFFGVFPSAQRGRALLDPEGYHYFDAPSSYPFGARFAGSGGPKRNLLRNGMFNYFAPSLVPGMTGTVAPVPTFAEVTTAGDFLTGVRSIRFTPTGVAGSRGFAFLASDNASRWITAGIRYRVPAGNTGFYMSVSMQGATRQYRDQEETPAGEWREGWISMPIDPSNPSRAGSVNITPDAVDGTGTILVDEVWVTEGRYSVPSTQYGERIEMLPAPITIDDQTLTGNGAFGPIDITNLPAVLAPPLDDFSAAPYGVVGAIYRFIVTTDSGAFGTALAGRHGIIPNVPAAGAIIPAFSLWCVSPQWSQIPASQDFHIRTTSISGVMNVADGFSTRYRVQVVAWILQ